MTGKNDNLRFSRGEFWGTRLSAYNCSGFTLTEYAYAPQLSIARHVHELPYFSVVLAGSYTETFGRKTRICAPNTVTYHPVGEQHSDVFHSNARIFSIEFDSARLRNIESTFPELGDPAEFCGGKVASLLVGLQTEQLWRDEMSPLAIEGLFLELVANAVRLRSGKIEHTPPRWIRTARELVHDQFFERLSLDVVAESVGVHPVHLAREFRRYYKQTVGEYIRERRVESARRALLNSELSLAAIALANGFAHQSHFSRTFKLVTGMTPSRYRAVLHTR